MNIQHLLQLLNIFQNVIYTKFLGFTLNIDEEKLIKEIDNALLWYDLKYLLDEESEEKQPKLHVKVDYTVRSFSEVEKEYLGLFEKYREV